MPDPTGWEDLRDRFLAAAAAAEAEAALESAGPPGGWLALWRLCAGHPWYRAELAARAAEAAARGGLPRDRRGDVEHDALLLLARKLRRRPGLGVDPARAAGRFAAWMGTVVRNDCRTAVRRLRRQAAREAPLPAQVPDRTPAGRWSAEEREAALAARADLSRRIDALADPERTVLHLAAKGLTLRAIADRLGLSYWRAYRSGADRLRRACENA